MGIEYENLDTPIINYCYDVDDEIDEGNANDQVMEHQKTSLIDSLIFNSDNKFLMSWKFLHAWMCLLQSYFFAYIGAFGFDSLG